MSAELNAHDSISGHVRNATKEHTFKVSKKNKAALQEVKSAAWSATKSAFSKNKGSESGGAEPATANGRPPRLDSTRVRSRVEGDLVDETPINRGNALSDNGPMRVRSERVTTSPTALPGSRKAISSPKGESVQRGPKSITAPGPTASETAAARAAAAAKGTKNKSSIKVAEAAVDLEDGPNFGKPVYSITDVPRQWNRNA